MEICFRKAVSADFDRLNALFREMLRAIYGKEEAEGYSPGALDYYFSGGEDWICLAEIDGRIEGFLSMEAHRGEQNFLYLDDLCVSTACRGKGVGSALLERGEAYCKSLGLSAMVLHVEADNERARKLYEKRGFTLLKIDGTRLCLRKEWGGI